MKFPSIEQYGEALQFPENTILDAKLRMGTVQQDGLGLPWGRSGAFALTFKVTRQGKSYAFRCFQSQRDRMHERYEAISAFLATHKTQGFVKFKYLDDGIKIQQKNYPAVIMDWAQGQSLGAYVEENLRDGPALKKLRSNIEQLALALEVAGIAHGDIQSQNILIDSAGTATLIDYDGMYVPDIAKLSAIESGHRNFQHPQREKLLPFDSTLDRFPFALIHTALSGLIEDPKLWDEYKCHPEKLLFTSKDLETPNASKIFKRLKSMSGIQLRATQLEALAKAKYADTPKFSEYLNGSTPEVSTAEKASQSSPGDSSQPWYMNPDGPSTSNKNAGGDEGEIVDARIAQDVRSHAGGSVQLVGKILSVELVKSGKAMPHAILTLLDSRSITVDVALWSEGIKAFAEEGITVDETWANNWIRVSGVLSKELGSSSGPYIRMVVTRVNQLERITHQKATYLLKNGVSQSQVIQDEESIEEETITRNENLIAGLGGSKKSQGKSWVGTVKMPLPANASSPPTPQNNYAGFPSGGAGWAAFIWMIAVIGVVAAIAALAAYLNNRDPSSSPLYQDSDIQQTLDTAQFDDFAELFEETCLTVRDRTVECSDSLATSRVIDVVELGNECKIGAESIRRSLGIICTVPNVSLTTTNQVQLKTCIDLEYVDGPYAKCFRGERWEYSACWESANGAILQQRLKGEWTKVKEDIAVNDGCNSDFSWTVDFTRKASGVGVKAYRIYIPSSGVAQDITVTVREG